MLYTILVVLIALSCLLLILAVLLQSGDGNGMSAMAGGSSSQMMGSRRTSDILSKSTTVLGTAFLILCVVANFAIDKKQVGRSAVQSTMPAMNTAPADLGAPSQSESALPAEDGSAPVENKQN
jgi:preprotein translocase subunit SecG